jgi:protein YibB
MITIVTAFFDIGRGDWTKFARSVDIYFRNFERLCLLDNPIILFTESKHRERLSRLQAKKANLVVYYEDDLFERHADLLAAIGRVQQSEAYKQGILDPQCPEYYEPRYVLVNYLKAQFCESAIRQQGIQSGLVAWIDFGYLKKKRQIPMSLRWDYPYEDKIHMYSLLPVDGEIDITKTVKENIVYIQGCHIIAPAHRWPQMVQLMQGAIDRLFSMGLTDDDQSMLLLAYLASPQDFVIHPADISTRAGNFFVFRHVNRCEQQLGWAQGLKYLAQSLFVT